MTYTMSAPTPQKFTLPYTDRDHGHTRTHHQAQYIIPRSLPQEQEDSHNFTQHQSITHFSLSLDATILRSWHDTSEYSLSSNSTTYYCMDLLISSFQSPDNRVLARYTGGKLKKDALYQLRGRFFLDQGGDREKSYFHIDEAVRFQGPGVLRSFRVPRFVVVGNVVEVREVWEGKHGGDGGRVGKRVVVRWETRDPYRRDMVYEQNATVKLELGVELSGGRMEEYVGRSCVFEGRMEGFDARGDWVCSAVTLC